MSKNKQTLLICIFLVIATLLVFWQVNHCDFVDYDDPSYVTENNHVQKGITIEGIRWAFTTGFVDNWHPLTWISYMLDFQLYGLKPQWFHVTNLFFHMVNTLLLFFVLYRMTKARWESAFVAALFALHPLHVESVAWVAERKDVLSAFFWMLTMGAYCSYVERPKLQRYLIVVLFFVLGLMAKPMLVTLPFVLLLLDYWPLQRIQQKKSDQKIRTAVNKPVSGDKQKEKSKKRQPPREEVMLEKPADSKSQWALIRPLLLEKIPLFILTVLSSIVTFIVQEAVKQSLPLSDRISNAFISYIVYIGKMIWPNNLAVLYPITALLPTWQVVGAVFLLTAITTAVIWKARRIPYLAVGWLWYVGTLVPVIGIVQVGQQARADRYTYIPLIGLFIIVAWGISEFSKKWRYRKEALFASSTVVLLCLCMVTWTQVGYWQNSITLFEHTLKVTDNNYIAYKSLGNAYWRIGNDRQAIGYFDKAIEINPNNAHLYYNRGNAYAGLGNYGQAIGDYDKVIEINPKYDMAYYNRGNVYSNLGNYGQAIADFDKAIEINPEFSDAYFHRANAYWRFGNERQSIEDVKTAARLGHEKAQQLLKSQGIGW